MLIDDVIALIEAHVADLAKRVEGAAELSGLVKQNALPPVTPAAFVLPLGLRGSEPDASAGLFRQTYDEVVGVVLVIEAPGDATGRAALPTMHALAMQVVLAVCGRAPSDQVGVFRLLRGALISLSAGTIIYQLDFAIQDQLRIAT